MGDHHLFEALTHFDPKQTEQLFGDERALLKDPDPSVERAPIKRVVIFTEAFLPKVDGVSKTTYLTIRYLQLTGREVLVFAPDIAPTHVGDSEVVPVPSVGLPRVPETRIALPHPTIAARIETFKPDLIQLFSPFLMSASGVVLGRQRQIPVIANYQTDLPGYARYYSLEFLTDFARDYLRWVHNNSHLTLVPSTYTMRELQSWGFRRMRRWSRGVDAERFNPARRSDAWREKLLNGRDPNSLLCVFVGRVAHEKRIELLLEAARTPGVAVTIIGDGAQRGELETLFAGTGTHFTGYMYGDDLADAVASADVFTFPGTQETFGQAVQEALASGLPAVVVNQGGVTDLVEDGVTGYVCDVDAESVAAAVTRLRDDRDLLRQMSSNARQTVEHNTWDAIMAQLEGHYREALGITDRLRRMHPPTPGLLPSLLQMVRPQHASPLAEIDDDPAKQKQHDKELHG